MTAPVPGVERDRAARLAAIEAEEPYDRQREEHARDLLRSWADAASDAGCPPAFVARMRALADMHDRHAAEAGPDQHQAADDGDVLHADLCELLNALGLGAYARPYSAHEVMQREIIPAARAYRTGTWAPK